MKINSVCVFCGARLPEKEGFVELAEKCGKMIAAAGIRLVYGGASVGLMGVVSRAAYENGGNVLGIYPNFLNASEPLSDAVTESILVDTMAERKNIMLEESDAFVILPGGVGTLDEVFEIITLKSLGILNKPIIFVNTQGYWSSFNKLMKHIVEEKFASPDIFDTYNIVASLEELSGKLGMKNENSNSR